jgi:hypothetical protein
MHHGRYGNADALLSFCFWSRRDLRPGILLLLLLVSRLLTLLYLNCNRTATALHTPSQHIHYSTHPRIITQFIQARQSVSQSVTVNPPEQSRPTPHTSPNCRCCPSPKSSSVHTAAHHPPKPNLLSSIPVCALPVRPALHPLPVLPGTPCPVRSALLLLLEPESCPARPSMCRTSP